MQLSSPLNKKKDRHFQKMISYSVLVRKFVNKTRAGDEKKKIKFETNVEFISRSS